MFGNLIIEGFFLWKEYRFWGKYICDFDGDDDYIFSLKVCLRKLKINGGLLGCNYCLKYDNNWRNILVKCFGCRLLIKLLL